VNGYYEVPQTTIRPRVRPTSGDIVTGYYRINPNDVVSVSARHDAGQFVSEITAYLRPGSFVKGTDMPGITTAGYTFGASDPTTVSFNLALSDARLVRRAMLALDAKKDLTDPERDALWVVMSKLTQAIREKTK
jgi:hypothetical protein